MPLREIRAKFTKSEIFIMAWRSQEQHYQFKKKMKKTDSEDRDITESGKRRKQYGDGVGPERMSDEFFDDHGDFNLSKVKGEQARQYFERVLRIPMPPGMSKIRDESDTSREIRAAYGIRR